MNREAQEVLDWLAARKPTSGGLVDDGTWLADFRAQTALIARLSGEPVALHAVEHRLLAGVPVRFYRSGEGDRPILFHLHGGGGIAGSLDGHDPVLRLLAERTGWTVAAPDYRLAPEARFPTQLDDTLAALSVLGSPRVVLSGDSIGATMATTLAALAKGRGFAEVIGQALFYPNTDLRRDAAYPSRLSEDGRIIEAVALQRQIDLYLADEAQRGNGFASPILAGLTADLPPVFIVTAEHDPLRDEGEAYAARLRQAGVCVEHERAAGALHAFLQFASTDWRDDQLARLKSWLDRL